MEEWKAVRKKELHRYNPEEHGHFIEEIKQFNSEIKSFVYRWLGFDETPTAPVTWTADLDTNITALVLYRDRVYTATLDKRVVIFDLDGEVQKKLQLPLVVDKFMIDGDYIYAWCPQKNVLDKIRGIVFDLSEDEPRRIAEIDKFGSISVFCTVHDGLLVLADHEGSVMVQTLTGEQKWFKQQSLPYTGLLLADDTGVYVSHKGHITKYNQSDGEEIWTYNVTGRQTKIQACEQTETDILFTCNGKVQQINKSVGSLVRTYSPSRHQASGLAIGQNMLITGSCPSVIFDMESGQEKYRMNFSVRLGSMQIHSSGKTFVAYDQIYCLNLTPEGIQQGVDGKSRASRKITVSTGSEVEEVESVLVATSSASGAAVRVKKEEDGGLTARAMGIGYKSTWPVLFPLQLLQENKKYIVETLTPCEQNQFYRVRGRIYEVKQGEVNDLDAQESDTEYSNSAPSGEDLNHVETRNEESESRDDEHNTPEEEHETPEEESETRNDEDLNARSTEEVNSTEVDQELGETEN